MTSKKTRKSPAKEDNVCAGCPNNCCIGVGRILVNQEELNRLKKFSSLKIEKEGPFYRVSVVQEGDTCPYFFNQRCTIYDQRPFDCRLYPLIIDEIREINGKIIAFYKFHRRCPQVKYFRSIWSPEDSERMRAWLKAAYPEKEIQLIYRRDGFIRRALVRLKRMFGVIISRLL